MKTSEFIKKWNEDGQDEQATRFGKNGVIVRSSFHEILHIIDDQLTICGGGMSFTSDDIGLINSYLQTKPENRKDERKWVIPWGIDASDYTQNMWLNQDKPMVTYEERKNWKSDKGYQFTDFEIEKLKSTQSPAIAQAIDIAKELVSDET
ncbi:hypothetical protein [Furfurilactobacillus rossiae]|uniref:Uncharacterized protein n=1 Tax=Furfurilactobacillus rossiae DSM 15814 TaxID=1114972 RepID=A0A0R1RTY5_9LACO|nr:hypothetical protein [Furfurilactobacillus rossiae]KRL56651.1 hypothetical protein FD35_GL001748 [Furfurilactobacillus rossiae DSM 15814]QFR66447.1 hypothetical protein LR814_04775 [Furfurilactobacillus rossiae]QLE61905.1 hypothetical protein LROSRS0_1860 [Furfurilactobacillus rossiae]